MECAHPELTKEQLFSNSGGGVLKGTERLTQTEFRYELSYLPVESPAGDPIGEGLEDNRLVKVDAVVWWWNEDAEDARAGMGQLRVRLSRIFHEGAELR